MNFYLKKIRTAVKLIAVVVFVFAAVAMATSTEKVEEQKHEPVVDWQYFFDADGKTETRIEKTAVWTPTLRELVIIGKMAVSIYRWKTAFKDGNETAYYYECGVRYTGQVAKDRAALWAYHIVRATSEKSGTEKGDVLNPWGVAGTVANESAFDLCAIGLGPRSAAYRLKIVDRSVHTISHTVEEIEKIVTDPRMNRNFDAFDLGGMQVLSKYYPGNPMFLITWQGFYWQVEQMMRIQRNRKTDRPWMYWPGYKAEWKHEKVAKYARRLGASEADI